MEPKEFSCVPDLPYQKVCMKVADILMAFNSHFSTLQKEFLVIKNRTEILAGIACHTGFSFPVIIFVKSFEGNSKMYYRRGEYLLFIPTLTREGLVFLL